MELSIVFYTVFVYIEYFFARNREQVNALIPVISEVSNIVLRVWPFVRL